MSGDSSHQPRFGQGPLSNYERPPSLRAMDTLLGLLLLGLLGYAAYKGYWEMFVGVLAVAAVSARRDVILGFHLARDDD